MSRLLQRGFLGIVTLIVAAGLLAGCVGEDDGGDESALQIPPPTEGVTTHPVEERIPYHDRYAIPITKDQSVESLLDPPQSLQVLASWLQNPQTIDTTQLGFFVDDPGLFRSFGVASIGGERVILFDGQNRLFEHNLQTGETTQLTRRGEGPGELQGGYDLMRDGSDIYVSRRGRRVEHFTCEPTPCQHSETIRLPVEPFEIARREHGLAALGLSVEVIQGGESKEFGDNIHLMNAKGSIERSFGAVYLTGRLMVWQKYMRHNSLSYIDYRNSYALSVGFLPYIWLYSDRGNINSIFMITDYSSANFEYDSQDRSMSVPKKNDYNIFRSISIFNSKYIILKVQNIERNEIDYYAIDLENSEPYFIGTDAFGEDIEDRSFYVTDRHQVIVENGAVGVVE